MPARIRRVRKRNALFYDETMIPEIPERHDPGHNSNCPPATLRGKDHETPTSAHFPPSLPMQQSRAISEPAGNEGALCLGIISDTHGQFSSRIATAFAGVDLIIHAGDVGSPSILMRLENITPNVIAVRGNSDYDIGLKLVEKTFVANLTILVAHTPTHLRRALAEERQTNTGPLLAVHGHTHIPAFEQPGEDVTLVCPGSATWPRAAGGPTVMILQLANGAILSHHLTQV